MKKYTLTIICEFLNEMGVLVNHTLKTEAVMAPQLEDKFMFISKYHFKPIVIRIKQVINTLTETPYEELVCAGEEVDELNNIKEVFYHTWVMADGEK